MLKYSLGILFKSTLLKTKTQLYFFTDITFYFCLCASTFSSSDIFFSFLSDTDEFQLFDLDNSWKYIHSSEVKINIKKSFIWYKTLYQPIALRWLLFCNFCKDSSLYFIVLSHWMDNPWWVCFVFVLFCFFSILWKIRICKKKSQFSFTPFYLPIYIASK